MEINESLLNNLQIGKTANPKYALAKEISDYFNGGIDPKFILGRIGKIGELAVRQEFERSKTGERPLALFIWLLKQHKVEYLK